jgi:hypothetical protein
MTIEPLLKINSESDIALDGAFGCYFISGRGTAGRSGQGTPAGVS